MGLGVLVGLGVSVIVGDGIGELVSVGRGRGELVCVGINVGVFEGFGFELPPCLGRCVPVGGRKVADAMTVVVRDAAGVGEKEILPDANVGEGDSVGVIKF